MANSPKRATWHGLPLPITGTAPKIGGKLPSVTLYNYENHGESLGKICSGRPTILVTLPSFCTKEGTHFLKAINKECNSFSGEVNIIAVSMDLPFAQYEWMNSLNLPNILYLSDHREGKLGKALGAFVRGWRVHCPSVFVADERCNIEHYEIVANLEKEPNFTKVKSVIKELVAEVGAF